MLTLGGIFLFLITALSVVAIAFGGAISVGLLITAGVLLGKWISRKLPELWERIP